MIYINCYRSLYYFT